MPPHRPIACTSDLAECIVMRDAHAVARLNNAVKACVDDACDSGNPLTALMRYVDSLRDNDGWSQEDIADFEHSVLWILKRLKFPDAQERGGLRIRSKEAPALRRQSRRSLSLVDQTRLGKKRHLQIDFLNGQTDSGEHAA